MCKYYLWSVTVDNKWPLNRCFIRQSFWKVQEKYKFYLLKKGPLLWLLNILLIQSPKYYVTNKIIKTFLYETYTTLLVSDFIYIYIYIYLYIILYMNVEHRGREGKTNVT